MSKLNELALKYGTDKSSDCHDYARQYEVIIEQCMHPLDVGNVIEIGVCRRNWKGNKSPYPSLQMWHDYFPGANVHGVDMRPFRSEHSRVHLWQADQSKVNDLSLLVTRLVHPDRWNLRGKVDLIIDDGSHCAPDQQITMLALWPLLRDGGLYIIEDLNCNRGEPAEERTINRILLSATAPYMWVDSVSAGPDSSVAFKKQAEALPFELSQASKNALCNPQDEMFVSERRNDNG